MATTTSSSLDRHVDPDYSDKAKGSYEHHDGEEDGLVQDHTNILQGLTREEVIAEADRFVADSGLQDDAELFRKAALVAQYPKNFDRLPELSDGEKAELEHERTHIWSLPGRLYYSVFLCAIGAATQGWDQTGSNGANLSFPKEFGIAETDVATTIGRRDTLLVGLVNGGPYLSAAIVGCWLSDPLNHYFGRRGEIFITAIVLIITPICSGLTHTWGQLLAVRILMGLGLGAKAATVPMYCAEMAPARIRGALTMGWQLWTAFGIFLGFAANAVVNKFLEGTSRVSWAWRLQLGSAFIPAVPLAAGIYFCPESPRWYMKKGRPRDAWRSMQKLRSTRLQAARDLFYASVAFDEELKLGGGRSFISRLTEVFTIPRCRRAALAAGVVMIAQQMCGINIMSFYSSTIFVDGGFSDTQALHASIGFGALNFVFAIPAVFTIDTFGRRSLLLATFPNMCWTLLAGGMCFFIPNLTTRTALVALFIYLFTIAYSVGEGPVPFMYSAEVFPLVQREQGMSFAVAWNNLWAFILSFSFPIILHQLTAPGSFGLYAGLNMLAFVMIFLWVPETKQLTLEELDAVFSIPTRTFTNYQVKTVLPWWFKRYILRKKDAVCPPLPMDHHVLHHENGNSKV